MKISLLPVSLVLPLGRSHVFYACGLLFGRFAREFSEGQKDYGTS